MTDPLQGRDPYPREQLELVDLHRERAELLEEIVSTPGPGQTATPARTKVLLAVGIAAALVIVGGGAWFATRGSDDADDTADQVAAAASPTATDDTTPTEPDDATAPSTAKSPDGARVPGVHVGRVLSPVECRRVLSGRSRAGELRKTLDLLSRVRSLRALDDRHGRKLVYLARKDGRVLAVDRSCRVLRLEPRDRADGR